MIEEIEALIRKTDEAGLIRLLKALTPDEKKKLAPAVKKATKNAWKMIQVGNTWKRAVDDGDQLILYQLAAFVCLNRTDYERSGAPTWMLNPKWTDKVLDWYCPSWFSDYFNAAFDSGSFWFPDYDWVLQLMDRGIVKSSPDLVARLLPHYIYDNIDRGISDYNPEKLLRHPATLSEHIWYLFQCETSVHGAEKYRPFVQGLDKEKVGWIALFTDFTARGLIDRQRVLRESLLAGHRNFNQSLSAWFTGLFEAMEPTPAELLTLQRELLIVLGAPTSKTVNAALRGLKKIVREKSFDAEGLLDTVPLLLAADTKSIVTATLGLLEDLGKASPVVRPRVALLAGTVFVHPVEELQTRAARLIVKTGDPGDEALRAELGGMRENLLAGAAKILIEYLDHSSAPEDPARTLPTDPEPSPAPTTAPPPIPFPANIDDVIFLASQSFDNTASWYFDLLPAALVTYAPLLKRSDLVRLQPAFQRAINILKTGLTGNLGGLDWLLSLFFVDVGNWLIDRHPDAAASIDEVIRTADTMKDGRRSTYRKKPAAGSYTAFWEPREKVQLQVPYRAWLLQILDKIWDGDDLPVLSTPTHEPGWIAPAVLVDRLATWQAASKSPSGVDWEIALARLSPRLGPTPDLSRLSGEPRQLLEFVLNDPTDPQGAMINPSGWLAAALSRRDLAAPPRLEALAKDPLPNYHGELSWSVHEETEPHKYKPLRIVRQTAANPNDPGFKGLFSRLLGGHKEKEKVSTIYDFLRFDVDFLTSEFNDIRRILSMTPNNPETVLIDIINHCLEESNFFSEAERKMGIATAQFLFQTWRHPGPMSVLFLACSLLNGEKTLSSLAAEIWLQAVSAGSIDNAELGRTLGRLEAHDYAPIKRLSDLITLRLFRISSVHNRAMETLLAHLLSELPDEPIKNLKRILEIYSELRVTNGRDPIPAAVQAKLAKWSENAGLQKTVKGLE